MATLPVAKLAWMAGVVDQKGRIIYKNNAQRRTKQVVLAVQVKELEILHAMGELTGTTPEFMKARPVMDFMRKGCADHCPEKHVHANARYASGVLPANGRWTITGGAMVVVLKNLKPYLVVDRDYDLAIEQVMRDLAFTGQGSGMIMRSLVRLKGLGWKIPDDFETQLALAEEKYRPVTRDEIAELLAGAI